MVGCWMKDIIKILINYWIVYVEWKLRVFFCFLIVFSFV